MDIIIYILLLNILLAPFAKRDAAYFLPIVMGALGLAGAVVKGIQAAKQASLENGINPDDPTYKTSQYAKDNLGLAQNLFNGRMAGAADLQRNIQGNQAGTIGSIERNATSSAQALALASGAQGQTNNALQNLQVNEAQNKQALAGQVMSANRDLVNEGDKEYNDQLRKYQQDVQAKSALRQASANNISGIFSDLTSGAMIAGSMGGFGGGKGNPQAMGINPAVNNYNIPIMPGMALPNYQQPGVGQLNMNYGNYGSFANPLNWRR